MVSCGWYEGFLFGATVFVYGYMHPDNDLRFFSRLAGAVAFFCYWFFPVYVKILVFFPGFLWFWYDHFDFRLRHQPFAKPFVIAIVWAFSTVLMAIPVEFWPQAAPFFIVRAGFIFALALLFDVLDFGYDQKRGLITLAGKMGIKSTIRLVKNLLIGLVIGVLIAYLFGVFTLGVAAGLIFSFGLSIFAAGPLIRLPISVTKRKTLVDSLMPVQFVLLALFQ